MASTTQQTHPWAIPVCEGILNHPMMTDRQKVDAVRYNLGITETGQSASTTNGKAGTGATRTRTRQAATATKTATTQPAARQRGSTGRKRATAPPGELIEQIYGLIPGSNGIANGDLAAKLGKRPQDLARLAKRLTGTGRFEYRGGAWFRAPAMEQQQAA